MRIKLFSQYFWPENFRINELSLFIKEQGFKIDVVTGQPSYPNKKYFRNIKYDIINEFKEIKIKRLAVIKRSKSNFSIILNYLSFFVSLTNYCIAELFKKKKYDFFLIFCPSPIVASLPVIILSKILKIKVIIWVLDLWPSTLSDMGIIKSKLLIKILENIVKYIYNSSDLILVQSKSFEKKINEISNAKTHLFYSWPEKNSFKFESLPTIIDKIPGYTYIVFTGNVGQAQGLYYLVKSAKKIEEKALKVKWIIVGDGRDYENVRELIIKNGLMNNFILVGNIASDKVSQYFKIADALFLSLIDNATFQKTIPGKLQTYMNTGIPILAMISGEAQDIIKKSNCGFAVNAEDVLSFCEIVEKFINLDNSEKKKLGLNGKKFSEKYFNRENILFDFKKQILNLNNKS